MRDKFAHSRLPDLPLAGYATATEKRLTDNAMFFIRQAERDRGWLLAMVCGGKGKFRQTAGKAWRHLKVDTDFIDAIFGYLVLLAGPNPHQQLETLQDLMRMSPVQRIRYVTGMDVH